MISSGGKPPSRVAFAITARANGKTIRGVALNEDSFTVQIMDMGENIRLLDKSTLRSFQKTRESAMPKYGTDVLSDKDLEDIVAYLISVGAK